jgi:ribosomal protein S18 acetylase RimI-like enzyme
MVVILDPGMAVCRLRPAEATDEEFLFRLFAESKEEMRGLLGDETLWRSLVAMQYRGRNHSYGTEFPGAEDAILCVENGVEGGMPVGRLLVDRKPDCWRIVDLAVLAAHCGKGLGRWAVENCQQRSRAAGAKLTLQVRPENRARQLYERLGFCVSGEYESGVEMVWDPAAADRAE